MSTIKLPRWATVVLGLAAGVLAYLNQATFGFDTTWKTGIAAALVFLGAVGVEPLLGKAFAAALHLPAWATAFITASLTALTLIVQAASMSNTAHAVIIAILTFAAWAGFSPSIATVVKPVPVVPPPPPAPRPPRPHAPRKPR